MEQKPLQKRRLFNLGIKTKLQLKYLKLIIIAIFVMMIVMTVTFYATVNLIISTAQLGRYAEARLSEVFSWMNWVILAEFIVFGIIAGFLSLKLTHKIAGPLFRVEKMIHEMAERGAVEEIKIRRDDELQDLVNEVNNLIIKLRKK